MYPKEAVTKIQGYFKDGVKQIIEVTSDGAEVENQNMTKVDLKLVVAGEETETLSLLSLKAGGGRSQIGQSSGKPFKNLSLFWKQNFNYMLPSNYENLWTDLFKKLANDQGKVKANIKKREFGRALLVKSKDFKLRAELVLKKYPDSFFYFVLSRTSINVDLSSNIKYIVDFVDSMALNFDRRAKNANFFMKAIYKIESYRINFFEQNLANKSFCSFVVSGIDKIFFNSNLQVCT